MNAQEIRKRLTEIQVAVNEGDAELAHTLEDGLHVSVLLAIATGTNAMGESPATIAHLALASREIQFSRYTA